MKKKNLLMTAIAIFGLATTSLAQIGFVCNNSGNVYKTTNGGSSWTGDFVSGSLTGISFVNANTGFVCNNSGNVYKTTNGGSSWTGDFVSGSLTGISFIGTNVGIDEFGSSNLFSVYPNPAQSIINVKADAKLIGSAYIVYDNTGKVVLSGKISSENTSIELGNLSVGIYLFNVGENLKQTFKVIKE
jgi:hypothetical protein